MYSCFLSRDAFCLVRLAICNNSETKDEGAGADRGGLGHVIQAL